MFIFIVSFEKNKSYSAKFGSLAVKLYKIQILNSCFSLVLSAYLRINYFGKGGLIHQINNLLITNIYFPAVIELIFDIFYYYKMYIRYKLKHNNNLKMVYSDCIYYFELDNFYLDYKYSFILYNLNIALFYCNIFPLSILYCVLALLVKYFSDKYIIITRSNRKIQFNVMLSHIISKELRYFPMSFVLGLLFKDLLLSYYQTSSTYILIQNIILLITSLLIIIFNIPYLLYKRTKNNNSYLSSLNNNLNSKYIISYNDVNPYYILKRNLNKLKNKLTEIDLSDLKLRNIN